MSYEIPIYKAERNAGLEELIRSQTSIAYACSIQEATDLDEHAITSLLKSEASEKIDHLNLYKFRAVLVTAGVWNKNDDVFDIGEVWVARNTPKDQPINDGHDCAKIIGHIIDDYPANDNMERLADNLTIDELPEKYHIVTGGVLYKHYDKKELSDRIAEILKAIAENKKFVSMECLFRGFDYAVIDPNGNNHVVPRTEESAFLTKHLRAYKGKGEYQGHKLGRLMRNITFSGKGMVDKPANPESVILSQASESSDFLPFVSRGILLPEKISQVSKTTVYLNSSDHSCSQVSAEESYPNMTEHENQIKQLQAELAKANESLKNFEVEKAATIEKQLKAHADENASLNQKLTDSEKSKSEMAKQLAEAVSSANEKTKALEALQAQQAFANRVSTLCDKLGETKESAMALANMLTAMSDEQFNSYADYEKAKLDAYKKAANAPEVTPDGDHKEGAGHPKAPGLETKDAKQPEKRAVKEVKVNNTERKSADQKGTSKVGPMVTAGADGEAGAEIASAEAIEHAKPDEDVALATAGEHIDERVQKTREGISKVITGYIEKNHAARRRGGR